MLDLLQRFQPLLRKYAALLHGYDDAYEELECAFIELIHKTDWSKFHCRNDGAYVNYIALSVRHQYIAMSKQMRASRVYAFSSYSEDEEYHITTLLSVSDDYENLVQQDLKALLTIKEFEVLCWTCLQGFSSAQVARATGESRQNINQKNNAP